MVLCAWSQSIEALAQKQQTRLEEATARLIALRQEIRDQQIPLGQQLADLRQEAETQQLNLREHRRLRDSASLSLEQIEAQVQAGRKELDYVTGNLFNEFESSLKSALSAGETSTFGEDLRQLDLHLERSEASETEQLAASLDMLQTALSRMESLMGGKQYPGKALGPEGNQVPGNFIQVGPLLYFSSSAGDTVGWVEETKSLQPKVRPIDASEAEAIRQLASSGQGSLPVDPTLGDAVACHHPSFSSSEDHDNVPVRSSLSRTQTPRRSEQNILKTSHQPALKTNNPTCYENSLKPQPAAPLNPRHPHTYQSAPKRPEHAHSKKKHCVLSAPA